MQKKSLLARLCLHIQECYRGTLRVQSCFSLSTNQTDLSITIRGGVVPWHKLSSSSRVAKLENGLLSGCCCAEANSNVPSTAANAKAMDRMFMLLLLCTPCMFEVFLRCTTITS